LDNDHAYFDLVFPSLACWMATRSNDLLSETSGIEMRNPRDNSLWVADWGF